MKLFREIIVGVDLDTRGRITPGSDLAIEQARWVARLGGSSITLVHSSAPDEKWDDKGGGYVLPNGSLDPAGTLAAAAERVRSDGSKIEIVLSPEKAWLAITRQALRAEADLVVVGKRTGIEDHGPVLGSVATKLLRECPGNVWVVKPGAAIEPRCILAATDLTPVGQRVLALAGSISHSIPAELHVVHAFSLPLSVQLTGSDAERQYADEARTQARETVRSCLPQAVDAELHIGLSSPTRAILECVERLAPDLVVMGTISREGLPGLVIGNTAERLLSRLDCSLLTVKPEEFVCPIPLRE